MRLAGSAFTQDCIRRTVMNACDIIQMQMDYLCDMIRLTTETVDFLRAGGVYFASGSHSRYYDIIVLSHFYAPLTWRVWE